MKTQLCLSLGLFLVCTQRMPGATLFVDQGNSSPMPPYSTWATAATTIQDAVSAAPPGALVLVTNGVYPGGLVVDRAVLIMAYRGPLYTVINGYGTNRCVWMTNGVRLDGFTLTNGWAATGAGAWCKSADAYITNCVLAGNSASGQGGGAFGGTLGRCTLTGNSAGSGGGAASATLLNCILTSNSAQVQGGGALQCDLSNSLLSGNTADTGGGVFGGALNNCTVSANQAGQGGGTESAGLNNSIIYFNTAPTGANADNCTVSWSCMSPLAPGSGNIDADPGFVDRASGNLRLQPSSPCINAGNNALVVDAWLDLDRNPRLFGSAVDMGCYEFQGLTSPVIQLQPLNQTVYSGSDVQFTASAEGATPLWWQWRFNGAALAGATTTMLSLTAVTTNQAGEYSALVTNAAGSATSRPAVLTVVDAEPSFTQQPLSQSAPMGGYIQLTAAAIGSLPMYWQWQFNGTPIPDATNSTLNLGPLTWDSAGTYVAVVTNIFGTATSAEAVVSLGGDAVVSYVWTNSPTPTPPYTNWATAAHTIQEAINAAAQGAQVLVTNGVYKGALNVGKSLALLSVNGPQFTTVDADYVLVPCVSLTDGTSLSGFTLTHGYGFYGGGLWCASTNVFVTNCVMVNNRAQAAGGGAYNGTLYDCTLTGNTATNFSGGAYGSILHYCVVSTNICGGLNSCTAYNSSILANTVYGGGVVNSTLYNCAVAGNGSDYFYWDAGAAFSKLYNCTLSGNRCGARNAQLYNCIVYYSNGPGGTNYDEYCTFNYCCTTPMPTNGLANITNAPLFVNSAGGDLRLQEVSPCINAGNYAWAYGPVDLGGNPRIVSGTVDMGAYEYQGPGSAISYAWLQQYGFAVDGSADAIDTDLDGMNNWQEWVCNTNPTNSLSVLRMLSASPSAGNSITVTWQSVAGTAYFLQRSSDLQSLVSLISTNNTNCVLVATNVVGQAGQTSYKDSSATGSGPFYYRVGVRSL